MFCEISRPGSRSLKLDGLGVAWTGATTHMIWGINKYYITRFIFLWLFPVMTNLREGETLTSTMV